MFRLLVTANSTGPQSTFVDVLDPVGAPTIKGPGEELVELVDIHLEHRLSFARRG